MREKKNQCLLDLIQKNSKQPNFKEYQEVILMQYYFHLHRETSAEELKEIKNKVNALRKMYQEEIFNYNRMLSGKNNIKNIARNK